MKKLIALILATMMLLSVSAAFAANGYGMGSTGTTTDFDYSVIQSANGYEYDAFERSWSYHQAYVRSYSDARVVIGLQLDGEGTSATVPVQLYCWIRDASNSRVLHQVTGMSFMIGNDIYRYRQVLAMDTSSCVLLGPSSEELLQAMAAANSITVRLEWSTSHIDIEIPAADYRTTLKAAATLLLQANALYACDVDEWSYFYNLYMYEKY